MRVIMINKRGLFISLAVIIALLVLIFVLLLPSDESSGTASVGSSAVSAGTVDVYELDVATANRKELPVYSVDRNDMKIALTIDAAWEDDKTEFILQELKSRNIHATFFLCGFWAEKHPDKVKAIHADGHEIGNHSATHPHMNSLTAAQIQEEVTKYDDLLESLIGERSKNFRAPYGEYNDQVITTLHDMGYEVIQWTIDTIDWKEDRSAQTILDKVASKLAPGSIILCHNNGYKIKEYLPTMLDSAIEQGYEFVTVSELLLHGDTMVDVNGVQKTVSSQASPADQ